MPQQARHSAYIYALSNEHAGVSVPQAVHVQIVRQIALPQNLFEPECECPRHHRIPAGLPEQIVLFLQSPFTTLFFLPRTFFLPGTKQFAEFFRQIYHPHPRTGLRFFHQDRLAAQLYYIAPDMQRPPAIERVSAQEYAALREQALRGRAHVELSAALLAFQADLCDLCGGALVRIANGCAVAERDGAQLLIKELLGTDVLPAVQALLADFGAQEAQLCVQRPDGAQALAAYRPLSCAAPDVLWGLYLD